MQKLNLCFPFWNTSPSHLRWTGRPSFFLRSYRKLVLSIFIFIILPSFCIAQTAITKKEISGKAKNLYERALEYMQNNRLDKAKADLEKVLSIAPYFVDAHIKYGAIQYDSSDLKEAEQSFEKALALKADYKPNVYYMLALTEAKLEKYDEAVEHLDDYLATDHKSSKQRQRAQDKRQQFAFVAKAIQKPVPFEPTSMGDFVNSEWPEYLPSLTADGETLIFTRRVRGQEDFFQSTYSNGKWGLAIPMNDINDPINNEGAQNISADGRFLVFTACNRPDGYGQCDLYYSELRDGRWTPPANMGEPINSRSWESQPSLAADGKTIYFSSKRQGCIGGNDIWVSTKQANGKWGTPQNLGENINTSGDEQSPFMHPDGQTLYFMSNGHPGMGKMDLFLARKQADGTWGEAQNLGYPINTESHEGAFVVSLDGKTAYFASDRDFENANAYEKKHRVGQLDLYSFPLYEAARPQPVTYVKAQVSDAETGEKLQAQVAFIDLATQQEHTQSVTDLDGEFLVCLPMGRNFALNVSKEKYLFHSENFALEGVSSLEKPYLLDIKLQKIPLSVVSKKPTSVTKPTSPAKQKPIVLRNIFFETGLATLRPESVTELNELWNLLQNYPNMRIQINGHTDNVGSDADNLMLSENRAKSVYSWLFEHGIDTQRLQYKGYGETQPIDTNDTPLGRQSNRRTEFVVL